MNWRGKDQLQEYTRTSGSEHSYGKTSHWSWKRNNRFNKQLLEIKNRLYNLKKSMASNQQETSSGSTETDKRRNKEDNRSPHRPLQNRIHVIKIQPQKSKLVPKLWRWRWNGTSLSVFLSGHGGEEVTAPEKTIFRGTSRSLALRSFKDLSMRADGFNVSTRLSRNRRNRNEPSSPSGNS